MVRNHKDLIEGTNVFGSLARDPCSSTSQRLSEAQWSAILAESPVTGLILRAVYDSIPTELYFSPKHFYLCHPDLNFQNVLVDPDTAEITGFIDWDELRTVSPIAGFARFPSWITRDWDPVIYGYGMDTDTTREEELESRPWPLEMYRHQYAECFKKAMFGDQDYDERATRLSHLVEAVEVAIKNKVNREGYVEGGRVVPGIVHKFMHEAFGEEKRSHVLSDRGCRCEWRG